MPLDANRVQSVFLSVVECNAPEARAAVLDLECFDDPALRRRVEALLRVGEEPSSLLDQPIVGAAIHGLAPLASPDDVGPEGTRAELPSGGSEVST
jgi:hypothetical protein